MSSEHQTVDHRNKLMGTMTARSLCDFAQHPEQEDTNFVNSAQNANGFSQSSDQTCAFAFARLWPAKSRGNMSCPDLEEQSCDKVAKALI